MPHDDLAIPILPCRSVDATTAFYKRLGFAGGPHQLNPNDAILKRGAIELHFFAHPQLIPTESHAGCYLRARDVDRFHQECLALDLPREGLPRVDRLEDKPWGLREFAIVDPDGNLIRIGQLL